MKRIASAAVALATLTSFTLSGQQVTSRKPPGQPAAATRATTPKSERAVPFAVGETLSYDVSWSSYVTAGTATTTVKEKKPSFNSTAYYIVAEGRPTPLLSKLYSVYYKIDSLLDSFTLLPQRGSVYSEEGKRHRFKTTQFDRAAGKVEFATSAVTQDLLSSIYVLRAIPLRPGDTITMPVADNGINYKVQFDVGAAETVRTPMGDRQALKLRLSVFDSKNQPAGKNVAIWISEDARHLPVKLRADLPVGSFNLLLRDAR
jgi:hypothetical protein